MLMQEHWKCGYSAGKYIPETQAGLLGCVTAGWQTGRVSNVTRCTTNDKQFQ